GVRLAGRLADPVPCRGPPATPEDRRVAAGLAERAAVEPDELGAQILRLAADISDRSAEQLLLADFKDFSAEGCLFGIGVIETPNGAEVLARRAELLAAMGRLRERGYTSVLFA